MFSGPVLKLFIKSHLFEELEPEVVFTTRTKVFVFFVCFFRSMQPVVIMYV